MEKDSQKRNYQGIKGNKSWGRELRGGIEEEESWKGNRRGIMEEESKRNRGGEILQEKSWRMISGRVLGEISQKRNPGVKLLQMIP